jgi:DNA-directed RNA polymerase specialized sigma subunit
MTCSLDVCLSEDNENNLQSIIPARPDDYEGLTEDLIDSFIEHERRRRYQCPNAKSDIIERDLAILEEYLYGVTFFEQPRQESIAKKYGVNQVLVSRTIRKGKKQFKEFIQPIDTSRTS